VGIGTIDGRTHSVSVSVSVSLSGIFRMRKIMRKRRSVGGSL